MAIRITETNPETGACEAHHVESGERICRLSKVVGPAGLWVTDLTGRQMFETAQEAAVAAGTRAVLDGKILSSWA